MAIVIISSTSRPSREWAARTILTGHDVVDWSGDAARKAYLAAGYPAPGRLPAVLDPQTGVMVQAVGDNWPLTLADAVTARLAYLVRADRDGRLREDVDAVNAVRWDGMDEDERQAWRIYRQALLDVPQQDGFPHVVDWPVAPAQGGE